MIHAYSNQLFTCISCGHPVLQEGIDHQVAYFGGYHPLPHSHRLAVLFTLGCCVLVKGCGAGDPGFVHGDPDAYA